MDPFSAKSQSQPTFTTRHAHARIHANSSWCHSFSMSTIYFVLIAALRLSQTKSRSCPIEWVRHLSTLSPVDMVVPTCPWWATQPKKGVRDRPCGFDWSTFVQTEFLSPCSAEFEFSPSVVVYGKTSSLLLVWRLPIWKLRNLQMNILCFLVVCSDTPSAK